MPMLVRLVHKKPYLPLDSNKTNNTWKKEQFVSICSAILRPNAFSLSLSLCWASLFTVADKGRYGIFPAISCLPSLLFLYLPTRSHPKKRNRASKPLANFFPASENKTHTARSSRRWQHCKPLLRHQYFRFHSLTLVTPTKWGKWKNSADNKSKIERVEVFETYSAVQSSSFRICDSP